MAAVSSRVLTHLDPQNIYGAFDTKFDEGIYIRFTITAQCVTHVQIHAASSVKQVHFFLPDIEKAQTQRPIHGLSGTRIYIYCSNEQSVSTTKEQYPERARYKIFAADHLEFHLHAAQIELLAGLVFEAPRDSHERNELAAITDRYIDQLKMSFQHYVDARLSEEVKETNQDDINH